MDIDMTGAALARAREGDLASTSSSTRSSRRCSSPTTARPGRTSDARVELDRKSGHVTVLAARARRGGRDRPRVGRHARGLRPDRRDDRQAGDPAAAARRRGRPAVRRVLRQGGRRRLRRRPAGPRPRHGLRRPRQDRGGAAGRRAGAGRAVRPRPAHPVPRRDRAQGTQGTAGDGVALAPQPGQEALRARGARDRRRHRRDRRRSPARRAPHRRSRSARHVDGVNAEGRLHRPDGPAGPQRDDRAARREDRHRRLVRGPGAR